MGAKRGLRWGAEELILIGINIVLAQGQQWLGLHPFGVEREDVNASMSASAADQSGGFAWDAGLTEDDGDVDGEEDKVQQVPLARDYRFRGRAVHWECETRSEADAASCSDAGCSRKEAAMRAFGVAHTLACALISQRRRITWSCAADDGGREPVLTCSSATARAVLSRTPSDAVKALSTYLFGRALACS